VFALDYSSSVTKEEIKKEINFVQHLAQSWNLTSECSKAALVVYGDNSETVIPFDSDDEKLFSDKLGELKTETLFRSKCRRMDLALKEAADNLTAIKAASQNQYQLVIIITAGKQFSNEEGKEDTEDLISSSELLYSSNVKVIIVPVGLETDFKELGLIVKRLQSLFPLSSFDDLTQARAQEIASHIYKTIGENTYCMTCIVIACCKEGLPLKQGDSVGSSKLYPLILTKFTNGYHHQSLSCHGTHEAFAVFLQWEWSWYTFWILLQVS